MTSVYSTEDLLKILAEERRACMNGERLNLNVSPSGISPFIDMFLQTEGIQKFTAYNDFKATIHRYQQEHQISGVIWERQTIGGRSHHYPRVAEQLISLPQDLLLIQTAKEGILSFWQAVTEGMDLYLSLVGGKVHQPITRSEIEHLGQRSQWATLSQQGRDQSLEIILQLGWGKPEEAHYRRGWPESGSEYVHAVMPGQVPLG